MSMIRCLGTKTDVETVLWTNNSPTSTFSSQTITLSDDISNYSYIRIEGRFSDSDSQYLEVTSTPEYLFTCNTSFSTLACGCCLGGSSGTGASGARVERALKVISSSPNEMVFGTAYALGTGNSSSTNKAIPTRIVGIK